MDFSINNELGSTFNMGSSNSRLGVPGAGSAIAGSRLKSPGKILMPPKSPVPPKTGYGGMRSGSKSNLLYAGQEPTTQDGSGSGLFSGQRPATQQHNNLFVGSPGQGPNLGLPDINNPNPKQSKLRVSSRGMSP
jgi:hypothetical protein